MPIIVKLPTQAKCEGCADLILVELVLMAAGGFGFRPVDKASAEGWAFGVNPSGVFEARCPKHPPAKVKMADGSMASALGARH
jgi:hypothetical protein